MPLGHNSHKAHNRNEHMPERWYTEWVTSNRKNNIIDCSLIFAASYILELGKLSTELGSNFDGDFLYCVLSNAQEYAYSFNPIATGSIWHKVIFKTGLNSEFSFSYTHHWNTLTVSPAEE